MSVPNQRIFVVSPKEPDADAVILPLYDGKVSITLSAMGGAGGKGGNGGRGNAEYLSTHIAENLSHLN